MGILVQKFGGTSLSTVEAREQAIRHIRQAIEQEHQVVVVVSAMGRKGDPYATDTLLDFVARHGGMLRQREQDLLLSCGELISAATLSAMLQARGITAPVLTGGQAGLITNEDHGDARIVKLEPDRVLAALREHPAVIVAGFQGRTLGGEITTLGRGGSDTSATALGAALHAELVEIYTDVNGILTADPRIVQEAKQLERIAYQEVCNMAYHGAKVIHPRAVEVAMAAGVPIRIRSTFSDDPGTLVAGDAYPLPDPGRIRDRFVTGIAHTADLSQIQVRAKEGQLDLHLQVFKSMAENGISVDFINVNPSGAVYTVFDHQAERALTTLQRLGYDPSVLSNCAKVSVIGGGINGVPGIMARIVEALTEEDVEILQSADSNTTIWVLVRQGDMARAVRALHRKFKLDQAS